MLFRHNWEIQTRPAIGKIPLNGTPEDQANTLPNVQPPCQSSAQSPCQNESFINTSRKLLKNKN